MVSPEPFPFDPALEELLREIASDPRSCLLRIERPARPTHLADSWESLSRWTPGLTVAEKELLDVYRAETAELLRRRWLHEVTVRPREGFVVSGPSKVQEPPEARPPTWDRSRELLHEALEQAGNSSLAAALDVPGHDRPLDAEALASLLVSAHSIEPSVVGKIYLANDLILGRQFGSAIHLLGKLLRYESRDSSRVYIWSGLGYAQSVCGRVVKSAACYARASAADEGQLFPAAYWLILATQAGDEQGSLRAAEVIDALHVRSQVMVEMFVAEQARTRREGAWSPTAACKETLPRIRDRVDDVSRRILDALG